jgi:hypothetical protein
MPCHHPDGNYSCYKGTAMKEEEEHTCTFFWDIYIEYRTLVSPLFIMLLEYAVNSFSLPISSVSVKASFLTYTLRCVLY